MRFHEIITERGLPRPGSFARSNQVIDVRDPEFTPRTGGSLDTTTCIDFLRDGSALVYYWGDGNLRPWREVLDLSGGRDTSLTNEHFTLTTYKTGFLLDRGRETGHWAGDRNRYSDDVRRVAQALLDVDLGDASAPLWIGSLGRPQHHQLIGRLGAIVAASPPTRLTLYHGTSNARLDVILRDGLRPLGLDQRVWNRGGLEKTRPAHRDGSIYLTASPDQAAYYANKAVAIDRRRLGSKAKSNAEWNVSTAKMNLSHYRAKLKHLQSLTPEQIARHDEHARRYDSRASTVAQEIAYLPMLIQRAEETIQQNAFVAGAGRYGKMEPVVLQVTLGSRDMTRLMADDDFLARHKDADPSDWKTSLGQFGQVAYQGSISASRIRVLGQR